jgi:2-oxoglutarate dehydrogenase E2 component (dihydrolipoamide succinyltransferase)
MAVDVIVPSVGESITEGSLAQWLKKDGDAVQVDEPLFELETDKATTPVPSPASGTLIIQVPEGQTVAVGSVVAHIQEGVVAPKKPARDRGDGAGKPAKVGLPPRPEPGEKPRTAVAEAEALPAKDEVLLSPAAQRLAEEEGVDVRRLTGTGRGGRVTKEDVLAYVEKQKTSPEQPSAKAPEAVPPAPLPSGPANRESRQRMSSIRQRIAERLVASQKNAATLTTFNEADLSAILSLRAQYKDRYREKYGVSLGFMSFFVKACVESLRAFPNVNARIDGNEIVYHHFYNIGIAVSTEKGLMVPVLRDADRLSFADIERQIVELAQKARDGQISVPDLQGGTFTITNGGVFGSLLSTPILNPPQSGILGMHTIQKRPVAVNDQVVIRPMMYLALTYDHRLIDGREAVLFLVRVKECIESPERLLLVI